MWTRSKRKEKAARNSARRSRQASAVAQRGFKYSRQHSRSLFAVAPHHGHGAAPGGSYAPAPSQTYAPAAPATSGTYYAATPGGAAHAHYQYAAPQYDSAATVAAGTSQASSAYIDTNRYQALNTSPAAAGAGAAGGGSNGNSNNNAYQYQTSHSLYSPMSTARASVYTAPYSNI